MKNVEQREELKPLSEKAKSLEIGGIYQHYKGLQYKLIAVGRHSEGLEEVVIYEALYGDHDVWVRPMDMFLEDVVIERKPMKRFRLVN